MTCLEWSRQMAALREGELRLVAPEENGLSEFARRSIYDLREYVAALEHGYRRVCGIVDGYRKQEKVRPAVRAGDKSLQQLVENQWSEGSCLGYAGMLLMQTGLDGADTRRGLVLLEELLRLYDLDEAAGFYRDILDGKYDGAYQAPLLREERIAEHSPALAKAEKPEWIGVSAELKPEVPTC